MPSADPRPLVEDPALRGGALVLSRHALEHWLAEVLDRPCTVEPRRLRYKAGTSAVLGFDLTTVKDGVAVTEPCVARAYADHAAPKVAKILEGTPSGACLAFDVGRHVVVTTATGDRALPMLPRLAAPGGVERLLARLVPDSDPARARIRVVRHNPARRWVGVLERDGEATLLLRAYDGQARMARAERCYRVLGRSDTPTPRVVAKSRSYAVLAVSWAEGAELSLHDAADVWRAAGGSLARLHGSPARKLRPPDPDAEAAAVQRTGRQIAELLPEISADVLDLARTGARLLGSLPGESVATHGDFSADQVVVGLDGHPVLIDLDSARRGAAAYDLGCLVASTLVQAESVGSPRQGELDVAAFLSGYDDVRRAPAACAVGVHTVGFRLRKAIDPFRECAPDWREQVTARVAAARAALDDVSLVAARP